MADENYWNKGLGFIAQKNWEGAITAFTNAIEQKPKDAKAYKNRGVAYAEKGDFDLAIIDFTEAIKISDDYADAYANRGSVYVDKGEFDRAIEDFNKAIELDSNHVLAYTCRGIAYGKKEEFDRAIEDFNKAIELDSNNSVAYNNRGVAYEKKKEPERALANHNKAIELDPNNADAYNSRGVIYLGKREFDLALKDFNKVLELDPNHKNAIHNRAVALALQDSEQERKELEERITREVGEKAEEDREELRKSYEETLKRVEGFTEEYKVIAESYETKEKGFDDSLRSSLLWLVSFIGVLIAALVCLVVFGIAKAEPLSLLPWVLLGGLFLSPLAWRISYIRDEKRRNELLKLSYEGKAYLEDRWGALKDQHPDMEKRLMEHWMEKSPEETLLAFSGKGDSGSSPLTPAALAAIIAAVRRSGDGKP